MRKRKRRMGGRTLESKGKQRKKQQRAQLRCFCSSSCSSSCCCCPSLSLRSARPLRPVLATPPTFQSNLVLRDACFSFCDFFEHFWTFGLESSGKATFFTPNVRKSEKKQVIIQRSCCFQPFFSHFFNPTSPLSLLFCFCFFTSFFIWHTHLTFDTWQWAARDANLYCY